MLHCCLITLSCDMYILETKCGVNVNHIHRCDEAYEEHTCRSFHIFPYGVIVCPPQ